MKMQFVYSPAEIVAIATASKKVARKGYETFGLAGFKFDDLEGEMHKVVKAIESGNSKELLKVLQSDLTETGKKEIVITVDDDCNVTIQQEVPEEQFIRFSSIMGRAISAVMPVVKWLNDHNSMMCEIGITLKVTFMKLIPNELAMKAAIAYGNLTQLAKEAEEVIKSK